MPIILCLLVVLLSACSTEIKSDKNVPQELSVNRTGTRVEEAEEALDSKTFITLKNTDFQSSRRLERNLEGSATIASSELAPTITLLEISDRYLETYFPGYELNFLKREDTDNFSYVTYVQTYRGFEVLNARLIVRLLPNGEWFTMNSTLVDPSLLSSLSLEKNETLKSGNFFNQAHHILRERSMILPRRNDADQMEFFFAREYVLFSTENHFENWIWVNEANGRALAAMNPASKMIPLEVEGSISPNAPEDTPISVLFPGLSLSLDGGVKVFTNALGQIDREKLLGENIEIKLENEFVSVASEAQSNSSKFLKIGQWTEDKINLDSKVNEGPSLEEQNVYYWLMKSREYLEQKLGYHGMDYKLLAVTSYGQNFDNAFFNPMFKSLSFGRGGRFLKNTALSRDIVIHEFGHAVTHEIYGMATGYEFSAMNEAFSDYLAASITNDPRIADGAMHVNTGLALMRNVENNLVFPKNFLGNRFHDDGQMFSGALWNLRKTLGADKADKLIHEARLAQAKSIFEFYRELLMIDERQDDMNPFTASPHQKSISNAFRAKGLGSVRARFDQVQEDLTIPWKAPQGCWSVP